MSTAAAASALPSPLAAGRRCGLFALGVLAAAGRPLRLARCAPGRTCCSARSTSSASALAGALFIGIQHLSGAGWSAVLRRVPEAMMSGLPGGGPAGAPAAPRPPRPLPGRTPEPRGRPLPGQGGLPQPALRRPCARWWCSRPGCCWPGALRRDVAAPGRGRGLVRPSPRLVRVLRRLRGRVRGDLLPGQRGLADGPRSRTGPARSSPSTSSPACWSRPRRAHAHRRSCCSASGHLRRHGGRGAPARPRASCCFTFTTFWAYIWLSQYLLIWYGNLPEEVTHYARRTGRALDRALPR